MRPSANISHYRPAIDGLRAIAVVPVILFHAGIPGFSGGFVGVDIFFVISGYLITSIIANDLAQNRFSLRNFYERRARRILPALLVVMLASIPLAWISMAPSERQDFAESLLAVMTFSSNILFWLESGYFEGATELKPLLHTWSLGIEEQFYVFFPILILAIWRLGLSRILLICGAILIISLTISQYLLIQGHQDAAFYLLPSRFWELLAGSLLALFERRQLALSTPQTIQPKLNKYIHAGLASLGLVMVFYSILSFSDKTVFPGLSAVLPVLGTVLILYGTRTQHFVTLMLANRVFVGIGLVSYSAYLWHQPLFAFTRLYTFDTAHLDVYKGLTLLSFILAYLTWKFIENPFRNKTRVSIKALINVIAIALIGIAAFAISGIVSNGFEKQFNQSLSLIERTYYENAKQGDALKQQGEKLFSYGQCMLQAPVIDKAFEDKFENCHQKFGQAMVILGDSHSGNVFRSLLAANERPPFLVNIGRGSCRPADADQKCNINEMRQFIIDNHDAIKTVAFTQAGFYFFEDMSAKRMRNNQVQLTPNMHYIADTLNFIEPIAEHITSYWLGPWIEPHIPLDNPREMGKAALNSLDYSQANTQSFMVLDQTIKTTLEQKSSKIRYQSTIWHKGEKLIPLFQDGCITFRDPDHLSRCGEMLISDALLEKINQ